MSDTITKISSEYDMVEIMQNIGARYFGSDLSQQRVGMFGFLTESMSHMFGAAILDSSARANEYNTATAQRLETLLYEAAMLDIEVTNAVPETLTAYIGIQTSNIINPPHQGGFAKQDQVISDANHPICTLVLEKDAIINIANYDFMFEYDIQIKATWSSTANKYVYSVKYLTEGDVDKTSTSTYTYPKANTLTTLSNSYIPSYVTTKDGESILLFKVSLKQMTKYTDYYTVVKNDMISLTGVDFLYDNMLSHFNVYYKENNKKDWEYIRAVSVYDTKTYDEKIVHYEILHDESKIRINFDDFTPAYNAEFRVDMYGTLGSAINGITYTGDGSDIIITLNTLDERHSYAGLYLSCLPISSYSDGKDIPSIDEIRDRVIRMKSSLNSLDTEYDLYNFIKDKDSLNDYVFIKKRSDVKERRYAAFTIPRMETEDIIPSSTMNLCIPLSALTNNDIKYPNASYVNYPIDDNNIITVKAGTPLILNSNRIDKTELSGDYAGYDKCINVINTYYHGTEYDGDDDSKEYYTNNTLISLDKNEKYLKDGNPVNKYSDPQSIAAYEKDEKIFGLPYLIAYDKVNQLSSFYLNSISENVNMNMVEDEIDTVVNFAIDHINIERNALMGDDSYHITVSVMPNGDYTKAVYNIENESIVNAGNVANVLMLKGYMYNNDNTQKVDGYFDFKFEGYSDDIFTFGADIKIDDSISLDQSSSCSNMTNLYNITDIRTDDNLDNNNYTIVNYDGSKTQLKYCKANQNDTYLNMAVFNLKIGIGVYYLDYPAISDGLSFKSTGDVDNNDCIERVLLSSTTGSNVAYTHSIDTSIPYPDFVLPCTYVNETDKKIIPIKYTLTNVYDNSGNFINLYTDMSDFVKATSVIVDKYYEKSDSGEYYFDPNKNTFIKLLNGEEIPSEIKDKTKYALINDSNGFIILEDVPAIQYSKAINKDTSTQLINIITDSREYLMEMNSRITNNFSLDYKFFRTYGPCRYFTLSTVDGQDKKDKTSNIIYPGIKSLGNLDITIEFTILIRNGLSVSDAEVVSQLKNHIKSYIEDLNEQKSDYTIYMSNIITEMETKYIDFIKSIELVSINGEEDIYRILRYNLPEELRSDSYIPSTNKNIKEYIPEYINVPLENITINVTRTKY